ncbi:Rv2253/PknI dimerization domain-containing protein [Mycolicibacterium arenosum]|uniref:Secreted protein n=1 Tax=Mycolicibacterium arenosum TaxID=2952157 RepID=A0ABT1M2F9_9MYCO|nr:hypothetical protein [Mycolicibacterium sp. CAU 1645]MCP9273339.1 hypothetical protein [Mycolicibacterium sp. CAU 1645]
MGVVRVIAAAAMLATAPVLTAPTAAAEYEQYAPNGTYYVVSNGEWARTNDRYQDEPSVRSTWTVNTTCTSAFTCAGKVTSSLGWTEDIYKTNDSWYVKHYVSDWIPCPDGTRGPGLQVYRFYSADEEGMKTDNTDLYVGEDQTTGESGACGRNKSVVLTLPVKISRIA